MENVLSPARSRLAKRSLLLGIGLAIFILITKTHTGQPFWFLVAYVCFVLGFLLSVRISEKPRSWPTYAHDKKATPGFPMTRGGT